MRPLELHSDLLKHVIIPESPRESAHVGDETEPVI